MKNRPAARRSKKAAPPSASSGQASRGLLLPFPFFRWQRVNLPNQLTLLRMLGLPFFIALFLSDNLLAQWSSLALFGLLAFTDWLDGYLARKTGQVTNFGKIMDPLADKLLMLTVMICLVESGVLPGWMIVLTWWRELAVTGLRTLVAARRTVLAADSWGKAKTVSQVVAVIAGMLFYLVQNSLNVLWPDTGSLPGWREQLARQGWLGEWAGYFLDTNLVPYSLMILATILSLWSGIRYFRKNWEAVCLELEDAERAEP